MDVPRLPKSPAVMQREVMRRAENIWRYVRLNAHSLDSERACLEIAKAIHATNDYVNGELKVARISYRNKVAEYKELSKMHDSLLTQVEAANINMRKLKMEVERMERRIKRVEDKANEGDEWKNA